MSGTADLDIIMEDMPQLDAANLLRFKAPINLHDLYSSRKVTFEIDTDEAMSLLDDDEDEANIEEEEPVTETDPRRYQRQHGRKRSAIEDLVGSLETFYHEEEMAKMVDVCEDGAVKKLVVKEGNGMAVPDVCKVYVNYVLCGEGINEPLDSTLLRGFPVCVDFRNTDIIAGLFLAVKSMRVHEVAKVWIRYDYAYGEFGCPPRIPPTTDIHCIVEVLNLVEENQLKLIPFMTNEERQQLEFTAIYDAAKELREEGNGFYRSTNFWTSIKRYRKARDMLEDFRTFDQEDQDKRQELLYTVYLNLAACYLKVGRAQQTCVCCHLAIRSKENEDVHAKLYYRFAKAKLMLGDPEKAKRLNNEALRRAPKDKDALELKAEIEERIRNDNQMRKLTYQKMMGNSSKTLENPTEKETSKQVNGSITTSGQGSKRVENLDAKPVIPHKNNEVGASTSTTAMLEKSVSNLNLNHNTHLDSTKSILEPESESESADSKPSSTEIPKNAPETTKTPEQFGDFEFEMSDSDSESNDKAKTDPNSGAAGGKLVASEAPHGSSLKNSRPTVFDMLGEELAKIDDKIKVSSTNEIRSQPSTNAKKQGDLKITKSDGDSGISGASSSSLSQDYRASSFDSAESASVPRSRNKKGKKKWAPLK